MSEPVINPTPVRTWRPGYLPAYVGNGVVGLRVPRIPLLDGVAIVNGFAGVHPNDRVEAFARAPYPLSGEVTIDDATLTVLPERATLVEQAYDFSCGELTTRLRFDGGTARAEIEIVTFCSRSLPTIVAQELTINVDRACDVTLSACVDPRDIPGSWAVREVEPTERVDGVMRWLSSGELGSCGAAYSTELLGAEAERRFEEAERERLATAYTFRARAGRRYRLRHMTSLVPDAMHHEPDRQAIRLAYAAGELGFDAIRADNRRAWEELWRGRVRLLGATPRWQAMADAAFYYLQSSVHPGSPCSTSLFGMSYWPNYHYFRGHVMWDIESFALPPLFLTQPDAARSILHFREERLTAARRNASMSGYRGAQFPWESGLRSGDEAAPGNASAAADEHHVSLDVAHAFIQYVHATCDLDYARECAWPVVRDVADWLQSRVTETRRGFELQHALGVAEKQTAEDNNAFVNVASTVVLQEAIALADLVGAHPRDRWKEIAERVVFPIDRRTKLLRNYDGHRITDEKGCTPEAAAALLMFGNPVTPETEEVTYRRAVEVADGYVGSPMLSPLLGVFAARIGERDRALDLFERGYADFVLDPFGIPAEYSPSAFPDKTQAGPFTANLGCFLLACLYGLTGIRLGPDEPDDWGRRPPAMPRGWEGVAVDRVWARGQEMSLLARHGADSAQIEPI
jgi:trehalose/maltose hydrolase-like predicted phosphorylase